MTETAEAAPSGPILRPGEDIQDPALKQRVETIAEAIEEIRPAIQFDGGDCEFIGYSPDDGVVRILMHGACTGCALSTTTLQAGIQRIIQERVPEVEQVINIDDGGIY